MKKEKFFLIALLIMALATSSCWYNHKWEELHPNGQSDCDTSGGISYSAKIKPIIQQYCATPSCHSSTGLSLDYNNFTYVKFNVNNGKLMIRLRKKLSDPLHMPQGGGFLPSCDTLKIRMWIMQGALQN